MVTVMKYRLRFGVFSNLATAYYINEVATRTGGNPFILVAKREFSNKENPTELEQLVF